VACHAVKLLLRLLGCALGVASCLIKVRAKHLTALGGQSRLTSGGKAGSIELLCEAVEGQTIFADMPPGKRQQQADR
jgi:hypothetical protein